MQTIPETEFYLKMFKNTKIDQILPGYLIWLSLQSDKNIWESEKGSFFLAPLSPTFASSYLTYAGGWSLARPFKLKSPYSGFA